MDPKAGLLEKGGAVLNAGLQALGAPQEIVTRALTGGKYALPSDVPAIRKAFTLGGRIEEQDAALLSNIVADPNNLLAVPAVVQFVKGGLQGAKTAQTVSSFNELRLHSKYQLFSDKQTHLEKLAQSAGHELPIVYDPAIQLYRYDLSDIANPAKVARDLHQAKRGYTITELAPGQAGGMPADPSKRITGEGKSVASRAKALNPFTQYVRRPSNVSQVTKSTIDLTTDADRAGEMMVNTANERIASVLGDTDAWRRPRGPLARAMVYDLLDDTRNLRRDKKAQQAIQDFGQGEFSTVMQEFKEVLARPLPRVPGRQFFDPSGRGMKVRDVLQQAAQAGTAVVPPGSLVANFSSGRGRMRINPNTADLKEITQFYLRSIRKQAFVDPAADAIESIIGKQFGKGTAKGLTPEEWSYNQAIISAFRGVPTKTDRWLTEAIWENRDALRQRVWGQRLAGMAAAGDDLGDVKGLRGVVGRRLEGLIHSASKGEYLASKASQKAVGGVYRALLGGAVDSAVRNTTGLLSSLTEYTIPEILRGMGAYSLNKKWREFLSVENVLGRQTAHLEALLTDNTWGDKSRLSTLLDLTMAPFMATENFVRGSTFIAAFNRFSKSMPVGEAIESARDMTQRLVFNTAPLDVSPYLRDPLLRPFLQFNHYPARYSELIVDMARKPDKHLKNKVVRFALVLGGAISYARHLNFSMEDFILSGFVPFNRGITAPVYETAIDGAASVKNLVQTITNAGADPEMKTPSAAWRALGDLAKLVIPTGRYSMKVGKELAEGGPQLDVFDMLFSDDYDVRKKLADHPDWRWAAETLGVNPDPGVNALDRFGRLIGFRTVRDVNRRDFGNFIRSFIKNVNYAHGVINETAAEGGDVEGTRRRMIDHLERTFGRQLVKYKVPSHLIPYMLRPASEASLRGKRERMDQPSEQRAVQGLPKEFKQQFHPPEDAKWTR